MRLRKEALLVPTLALLTATGYAFTHPPAHQTCATVTTYSGTFTTSPQTTSRQAAEGIALLALRQRDYHFEQGLLVDDHGKYAIASRTVRPGHHAILGLLNTSPPGCEDSALPLLREKATAFK